MEMIVLFDGAQHIYESFCTELTIAIAHEVTWHEGSWWAKGYNRWQTSEIYHEFDRAVNHRLYG